ncbi:MAG: fused MFS/spermidine synthase [candidate division KSB1 bacterium]|nr:fused MFS/spermidine synthase [candidate division KSB1 bacterium]
MSAKTAKRIYGLPESAKGGFGFLLFLFTISGATGLVFQIVWLYRLALLFGNAVYATSATLAAFFLGLAAGGWFWGKMASRVQRPLTLYGLLELGIALSAVLWLYGWQVYQNHYADLVAALPASRPVLTTTKLIFSMTLLLLPTSFMGGTLPILVHYVGRMKWGPARRGTLLYAFNTLGAAIGVLFAGFYFMAQYGVNATYLLAMGLAAFTGLMAVVIDRLVSTEISAPTKALSAPSPKRASDRRMKNGALGEPPFSYMEMRLLAIVTGLLALALETLWFRMFAQVLQNSVYSFSAILIVFLLAIGLGGVVAHFLIRLQFPSRQTMKTLLIIGAILIGLSPFLFDELTRGLNYIALRASWPLYLWNIFTLGAIIVFPPVLLVGAVFPYLLKIAPDIEHSPGKITGRLVLFNSLGSTLGPILAGFVLLNTIGLWASIQLIAFTYIALALYLDRPARSLPHWKSTVVGSLLFFIVMLILAPPLVKLKKGEQLLHLWQGSDGMVSVVKSENNLEMRLDNYYTLGDTRSALVEQMQGHIPLFIHPQPKQILFLGMGTGITAGAALKHPVERVVTVELIGNVIHAAQQYFSPWTNGLFRDFRVRIIADDARNYLLGSREQFDVIIGDLFTPWHAGTGSMYTVEHFQQARSRLAPKGIFVQWLPLYQLTPQSFYTIAKSFAEVFETVTLWRADFSFVKATAALVGQSAGAKLQHDALLQNVRYILSTRNDPSSENQHHMAGLFYMGNLQALGAHLSNVPLNTDDRRTIEFHAPILSQEANAGKKSYIVGTELEALLQRLRDNLPPHQDPYLSELPDAERIYVEVGFFYYQYLQAKALGQTEKAARLRARILELAPSFLNSASPEG